MFHPFMLQNSSIYGSNLKEKFIGLSFKKLKALLFDSKSIFHMVGVYKCDTAVFIGGWLKEFEMKPDL